MARVTVQEVVVDLWAMGMRPYEIARLLGVSHQRVHQAYRGQVRYCPKCYHWHRKSLGHYPNRIKRKK